MEISLALGGGGVRGVAHIGVLQTLEKHGFKVKAIAGTSAGGLVGAVYAAGFSIEKIIKTMKQLDKNRSFNRKPNDHPSLLGLSGVTDTLSNLLSDRTFDDLEITFAATAVSLHSGKEIILRKGKVIDAVLATIAIPGVFPSQEIGGRVLIDGGVLDPVPVQVARWLAPDLPVVAVMLHKKPENFSMEDVSLPIPIPGPSSIVDQLTKLRPVQAFKIFSRSIEVTTERLTELSMKVYKPEVLISPKVGQYSLLQKINPEEMIQEGVEATEKALTAIESEANWMKKIHRKVKRRITPDTKPDIWENV
jgi:NTE family protein